MVSSQKMEFVNHANLNVSIAIKLMVHVLHAMTSISEQLLWNVYKFVQMDFMGI